MRRTRDRETVVDEFALLRSEFVEAIRSGRDTRVTRDGDGATFPVTMWTAKVDKAREEIDRARAALATAPSIQGHRRISSRLLPTRARAATTPSIARDGERMLCAWLEWDADVADRIVAGIYADDLTRVLRAPETVSGMPSDCHRPSSTFDAAGRAWVSYGRRDAGGATGVWASCLDGDAWCEPIRISDGRGPAFNQEVVAHRDGRVEWVWQQAVGGTFEVRRRVLDDGVLGEIRTISSMRGGDAWDPTVAAAADGRSLVAWVEYDGSSFAVHARWIDDGTLGEQLRIASGTDYGLHPHVVIGPDGDAWCAFDTVTIQGHAGSGTTRLRPTADLGTPFLESGVKEADLYARPDLLPNVEGRIRVVSFASTEGSIREAPPVGRDFDVLPWGLPRLSVDGHGAVTVAFRVLRRVPILSYYWEVALQTLGSNGWSAPATIDNSDGGLLEANPTWGSAGTLVAFTYDGRSEDEDIHPVEVGNEYGNPRLREHLGDVVWASIVRPTRVRIATHAVGPTGPATAGPPAGAGIHEGSQVEARAWRQAGRRTIERHSTTLRGQQLHVYWGDLHRHSMVSRCTAGLEPSLDDYHAFAKDVSEYDFWALTDHAEHSTAYQWSLTKKLADVFNIPGSFVTMHGFEWTSGSGHQNVIYGDVDRDAPIYSAQIADTNTPDKLWRELERQLPTYPVITIPHHPGSAMEAFDWSYYDERFMRLVEIFQACRGNYEGAHAFRRYRDAADGSGFVVDGLSMDRRFGLIASSDHGNGSSYIGVYAPRLDRATIFSALHDRRAFGATARDITIDFRIGEHFMGEEGRYRGPTEAVVGVWAYREIARVDLIRNGTILETIRRPSSVPSGQIELPLQIDWGYVNEAIDWSGSLTIDGGRIVPTDWWSPQITAVSPTRVDWHDLTLDHPSRWPQRGGIEVSVQGAPGAAIEVVTPTARWSGTLQGLGGPDGVTVRGDRGGEVRIRQGIGGLTGIGASSLERTWAIGQGEPSWYYVRVILVDGEMAWSSPIWLD